jgi:riboflavin transporter 2
MARFKDVHLTPYLIGEGLSGFLPIVVAMIQGSVEKDGEKALPCNSSLEVESLTEDFMSRTKERKEILFGPSIFFLSLLITLIVSWIAFFYLLYSKAGKKEYCHPVEAAAVESISMNPIGTTPRNMIRKVEGLAVPEEANFSGNSCNTSLKVPSYYVRRDSIKTYPYHIVKQDAKAIGLETEREKEVSDTEYFWLQGIIVFACLSTFGVFPPLQPYSTLPYGNWCMHYSVIATGLAYPVGASLALWKDASRLSWIVFWTILGTLISVYILVCAVLSPNPYLSDKTVVLGGLTESYIMGGVIMVSAWILYIGILSYVKTVVTVKVSRARGEGALFLVGLFTQIGSVFGAAFMFVAVNIFQWFKDSSCQ